MTSQGSVDQTGPTADAIGRVKESAARMGVELDEAEAAEWITAMATEATGGDVVVDSESGVFGHKVSMLDWKPHDLARIREMARVVGFEDRPGVETALALSGSAAQSKVQRFPGDCDFFERLHIKAASREECCAILAEVVRDKALSSASGPTFRLWEVKFGVFPAPAHHQGKVREAGWAISWTADEIRAGQRELAMADGTARTITWQEASREPGWVKLDWVISDPSRGQLANASNVLDTTWEKPDGSVVPMDGHLESYFQEVYLESESIPLFSRLVKHLSADAVDDYVATLEEEVRKYAGKKGNYGKAARRMYNVFRLTGRYAEAAYLRELFDEPATALYQVAALVDTLDEATSEQSTFDSETLIAQTDKLIMAAISALDGPSEVTIVEHLLRLRDGVRARGSGDRLGADIGGVRDAALSAVSDYFQTKLYAVPEIKSYLDELLGGPTERAAASRPGARPPR